MCIRDRYSIISTVKKNTLHAGGETMKGKDLNIALLFDFYGEMLTDKQKDVIDLYYNCLLYTSRCV